MQKKKLAKLTAIQDYRYSQLFQIAAGQGMSAIKADAEAWRGLCEEWPTLRKYQGAK